jgi:NAD(P)-dependent dehydrogenase (short-subunit alcohol dehydrogenase family)
VTDRANDWLGYAGTRVVVCGCSSGMGEATTRALLELGAEVVGLDVTATALPVHQFLDVDLADRTSIDGALCLIEGEIDALFVCSGLPGGTRWSPLEVVAVNFLGPRHLIEGLVPQIRSSGAIAAISSVAGMGFTANLPAILELLVDAPDYETGRVWAESHADLLEDGYGLSKQCLITYTLWRSFGLATERGARINCISPGPTSTPMFPHFEEAAGKQYMDEFPRPLGRNSTPEEQANALLFLNSAAASYITGHNLLTDGGFIAARMTGQLDSAKLARNRG